MTIKKKCIIILNNVSNYYSEEYDMSVNFDKQLVDRAKNGDNTAIEMLVEYMMPVVVKSANSYHEPLYDKDDLIQEGRVAVFNAINAYDSTKKASFRTFAGVCIKNSLINFVKKKSSQQIISSSEMVALSNDDIDEEFKKDSGTGSPDESLIENENYQVIKTALKKVLSPLEQKVIELYLDDYSYEDIAAELSQSIKSIDNALQRARKKLRFLLK